jgi:predicted MFS family arabinose efflux permease
VPTLTRDRLTWLVYLQLGVYGYVLYGLSPSIALLRDEQGVSRTVAGLHGTAMAAGALATGAAGPWVVARIGRGAALWSGLAGACAGVVLFSAATALPVTLAGAFVATLGGSLVVNSSSTVLADRHGTAGTAAVSEAHATAAAVGALAPLVVGGAVAIGLGWRAGLLVALVMTAVLAGVLGRVRVPDHRTRAVPHAAHARLPGRYWWAWGVIALLVAVEFCMAIWTSDVLRERAGLSEGAAAAGLTAVVAGMTVGRLAGGRLALRYEADWLLYRAIALTGAGFALFWVSTTTPPALAGLFVCGLGIALHFPVGAMRAIRSAPHAADLAAARSSLAAGLAVGVGPFLLGALADGVGSHTAFLVVPVLLALAAGCVARGSAIQA